MNTAAAAVLLDVAPATLRAWAAEKLVPCRIIERRGRRHYLFDAATLAQWKTGEAATETVQQPRWGAM